jgi:hypothetical protein
VIFPSRVSKFDCTWKEHATWGSLGNLGKNLRKQDDCNREGKKRLMDHFGPAQDAVTLKGNSVSHHIRKPMCMLIFNFLTQNLSHQSQHQEGHYNLGGPGFNMQF